MLLLFKQNIVMLPLTGTYSSCELYYHRGQGKKKSLRDFLSNWSLLPTGWRICEF